MAALLEQEVHRLRQPFKQVVNDALRRWPMSLADCQDRQGEDAHSNGKLSKTRGPQFAELSDEEISAMETAVQRLMLA